MITATHATLRFYGLKLLQEICKWRSRNPDSEGVKAKLKSFDVFQWQSYPGKVRLQCPLRHAEFGQRRMSRLICQNVEHANVLRKRDNASASAPLDVLHLGLEVDA